MEEIIVRKSLGGWKVIWNKPIGTNKGENVLASFCGGNLGALLAAECAEAAGRHVMCDTLRLDLGDGEERPLREITDHSSE